MDSNAGALTCQPSFPSCLPHLPKHEESKTKDAKPKPVWHCPYGCGKVYKKSSFRSIRKHRTSCSLKPESESLNPLKRKIEMEIYERNLRRRLESPENQLMDILSNPPFSHSPISSVLMNLAQKLVKSVGTAAPPAPVAKDTTQSWLDNILESNTDVQFSSMNGGSLSHLINLDSAQSYGLQPLDTPSTPDAPLPTPLSSTCSIGSMASDDYAVDGISPLPVPSLIPSSRPPPSMMRSTGLAPSPSLENFFPANVFGRPAAEPHSQDVSALLDMLDRPTQEPSVKLLGFGDTRHLSIQMSPPCAAMDNNPFRYETAEDKMMPGGDHSSHAVFDMSNPQL